MNKSLQDQLLGAGLVDKKKAKQISKQKNKADKQKRRLKDDSLTEAQIAAKKALEEKQRRDKELNDKKNAEEKKKAIAAQIVQLIKHYQIRESSGDIGFNFTDDNLVKKIYVSQLVSDQLSRGRLCLARLHEKYVPIPKPIADKIAQRDPNSIVLQNTSNASEASSKEQTEDDEYYAQFEIPDDLMW